MTSSIHCPFELKDEFKKRFRVAWEPKSRRWRICCWQYAEAKAWIDRQLAKRARK